MINYNMDVRNATPDQLAQIKALSHDDLLRAASTLDAAAIVEASCRLKDALQTEEIAIKRLTRWLVALTALLVVLTALLVFFGVRDLASPLASLPTAVRPV
jgi:hypothetical protein